MKPAIHARDHRPPKTYGPDDPGGADPITFPANSGSAFTTYRDCTLAQPNLYSFWPMDDASGGAEDIVGTRDLAEDTKTISGTQYPLYGVAGPFSALPAQTAIAFKGSEGIAPADSDRLYRLLSAGENTAVFETNHAFTLEAWIYPTADPTPVGSQADIFEYTTAGGAQAIFLYRDGSGLIHGARNGSGGTSGTVTSTSAAPLAAWTHVRMTYDGSTLRLYINGTLESSAGNTSNFSQANNTFSVGNNLFQGGGYRVPFTGRIADVAVYTAARSDFCDTGSGGGSDAPEFFGAWADGVGGVSWHLVQTDNIEDEAVGTDQIAPLSVTQPLIANDAVGNAQIADDAVGTAQVQDDAITQPLIADDAVGNAQIADDAVDTAQLADNSVTSAQIAAGAIVDADVNAAAAVAVSKLAPGTTDQVLTTTGGVATWGSVPAAAVEAAGLWELVMADGVTAPPVPVETEAQDDWVYAWISG